MEIVGDSIHLIKFEFEGRKQEVSFIETMNVTDGVTCDVYKFDDDETKDLGIIKVKPGFKTPLQRVLKGDRTVEGYISGAGKLIVSKDGKNMVHEVKDGISLSINVEVGETMQWLASKNQSLTAYEICFPPYEVGRFKDLS